jgi:hypothetical protein
MIITIAFSYTFKAAEGHSRTINKELLAVTFVFPSIEIQSKFRI